MNENVGTTDMTMKENEIVVEAVKGANSIPYRIIKDYLIYFWAYWINLFNTYAIFKQIVYKS